MKDVGWVALGPLEIQIRMALVNAEVVKREATTDLERHMASKVLDHLEESAEWLATIREEL